MLSGEYCAAKALLASKAAKKLLRRMSGIVGEGSVVEGSVGEGFVGEGSVGEGIVGEGSVGEHCAFVPPSGLAPTSPVSAL